MKTLLPWLRGALLALLPLAAQAQNVGIGTAAPDAAAALDIRATDRGLLVPRLTAGQRTGIAAPPQGLLVYQTDGTASGGPGTGFWYFAGQPAAWVFLNPTGGAADNLGNHTATQDLALADNALTGTGASIGTAVGLGVRADGGLNIGQNGAGTNVLLGYQAGQSLAPNVAGRLGVRNQFIGYQSGAATTTGSFNQFGGNSSGFSNTSGSGNQFSGLNSGYSNTTGDENQFEGFLSGFGNTTGDRNQYSGRWSGYGNRTGSRNQFSGAYSGFRNVADNNKFDGYESGVNNTTGARNHFSGYQSGYSNNTGAFNQFVGYQSGYSNTTGNFNQFDGYLSGFDNATGSGNLFRGYRSGTNNTTGSNNQFEGQNSGLANTTGDNNQFAGYQSGNRNTTGDNNTFAGYRSGLENTTGSNNTALGSRSGPANGSGTLTNATALGANVSLTQSNTLVLGNGANVGIGTSSPLTKLSISPAATEPKITLWDNGNASNHFGFGVSGGQLNYHVFGSPDSHVFFAGGKNGTGIELLRIQGNGRVGVGTNTPQARLDVNGDVRVSGDVRVAEEVNTPRYGNTGAANMIPVAYGRIRANGTTVAGTGNFTSSVNPLGFVYTVQFPPASGLSSVLFANYIVQVTTNDGGTSPTVQTNFVGKLTVFFNTAGPFGVNVPNDFSFVVYLP